MLFAFIFDDKLTVVQ